MSDVNSALTDESNSSQMCINSSIQFNQAKNSIILKCQRSFQLDIWFRDTFRFIPQIFMLSIDGLFPIKPFLRSNTTHFYEVISRWKLNCFSFSPIDFNCMLSNAMEMVQVSISNSFIEAHKQTETISFFQATSIRGLCSASSFWMDLMKRRRSNMNGHQPSLKVFQHLQQWNCNVKSDKKRETWMKNHTKWQFTDAICWQFLIDKSIFFFRIQRFMRFIVICLEMRTNHQDMSGNFNWISKHWFMHSIRSFFSFHFEQSHILLRLRRYFQHFKWFYVRENSI